MYIYQVIDSKFDSYGDLISYDKKMSKEEFDELVRETAIKSNAGYCWVSDITDYLIKNEGFKKVNIIFSYRKRPFEDY